MAKKRNIIVGQSGGPTSVINSSLAGVYKNAIERGFDKVYGMLPVSYTHLDVYKRQAYIMAAYEEAVKERYRFFSFGDAMLIL